MQPCPDRCRELSRVEVRRETGRSCLENRKSPFCVVDQWTRLIVGEFVRVRHLAALTLAVAVCALVGGTSATRSAPDWAAAAELRRECDRGRNLELRVRPGHTDDPCRHHSLLGRTRIRLRTRSRPTRKGSSTRASLQQGQTFDVHVLIRPGSFPYHCATALVDDRDRSPLGRLRHHHHRLRLRLHRRLPPPPPSCPTGATLVDVGDYFFNQQNITVSQGTTVCWTNRGQIDHTVTATTARSTQTTWLQTPRSRSSSTRRGRTLISASTTPR